MTRATRTRRPRIRYDVRAVDALETEEGGAFAREILDALEHELVRFRHRVAGPQCLGQAGLDHGNAGEAIRSGIAECA
jgi:hypothetical protein